MTKSYEGKLLKDLTDDELDEAAMDLTAARAKAEAGFKAQQKAINAERDRRSLQARIAAVDDDVIAAIRAGGKGA